MNNKKYLSIKTYGDSILREKCVEIEKIDQSIKHLVLQMSETMYKNNGVGLAAPQIGKNFNLFIVDISAKKKDLKVFINPVIIKMEGQKLGEEGCLSIPDVYAQVPRAEVVTVEATDLDGKIFKLKADGLLAVAIQHEYDHLKGKLFIDYLDKINYLKLKNKIEKIKIEKY